MHVKMNKKQNFKTNTPTKLNLKRISELRFGLGQAWSRGGGEMSMGWCDLRFCVRSLLCQQEGPSTVIFGCSE